MRRAGVRRVTAGLAAVLLAGACGSDPPLDKGAEVPDLNTTTVARAPGDPKSAGEAITAFGNDLFAAVAAEAGDDENVVISPTSIAVALAMVEPGATGDAQTEMRKVLHIADAPAFHTSMGALERSLESRQPGPTYGEEKPGEITMQIANAAYVQQGFAVKPQYLDAIAGHYGPAVKDIDFAQSKAAAAEVNKFIAEATRDRIKNLVSDDTFDFETRLALVNALYLKASWQTTFEKSKTEQKPFTKLGGSKVTVPLMHGVSDSSNRGDNWVAAKKSYIGGLGVQFILPDKGAFDDVARDLPNVLADYERRTAEGAALALPRFTTETRAKLKPSLQSLGLARAFEAGALLGIADDPRLAVEDVLHATFLAMDEEGTEAAAATVVLSHIVSGLVDPPKPVPVILDRPFIFRILDQQTGATLFIGRVMDPTT